MKAVNIIVAVDEKGGFGKGGKIPWHFKEDFQHFKDITMGTVCIMGRKTYEEILEMSKPKPVGSPPTVPARAEGKPLLAGRECIVLSRDVNFKPVGATSALGLRPAVESLKQDDGRKVFVLGGEKLFIEALSWIDRIHMTIIKGDYDCDRFFPIQVLHKTYKIDSGRELEKMYFVDYIKA